MLCGCLNECVRMNLIMRRVAIVLPEILLVFALLRPKEAFGHPLIILANLAPEQLPILYSEMRSFDEPEEQLRPYLSRSQTILELSPDC